MKPGSFVLFHNDAPNTVAALPQILEKLAGEGYSFEFISDMIVRENYTLDSAGRQIPK